MATENTVLRDADWQSTVALDYDRAAEFYDESRTASPSLIHAMLDALGPANGRSLVEVGCGTGNYTAAFAEAGFRVVGFDLSSGMLRRAAGKLPGRFAAARAQNLPLADRTVDVVVTVNVFHHLPDPLAAFREFRRVARDCTLHHLTTKEPYLAHWAHHYFPLLQDERPGEHPETRELIRLAQRAGFADVQAVRFDYSDIADVSLMPLRHAPPWLLLDPRVRAGISCLRRLKPEEQMLGSLKLRYDLTSGRFAEVWARYQEAWKVVGDSTLLFGRVPGAECRHRPPLREERRP